MSAPSFYLIDSSVYIFRAYFGIPGGVWTGRDGSEWGALYGFARFLLDLLQRERPVQVAACFDRSLGSGFRHRLYPDYKANRALPDDELARQLEACELLAAALGVHCHASREFEADDLIASLGQQGRESGYRLCIVSRDKDLGQVLADGDQFWDGAQRRWDREAFTAHYGVGPSQVADYLALVGDAVDNIPGVPGIGPKTTAALLARAGSLTGLYQQLGAVSGWPLRGAARVAERLQQYREQVELARQLTGLRTDIELHQPDWNRPWQPPAPRLLEQLLVELEIEQRMGPALLRHRLWKEAA